MSVILETTLGDVVVDLYTEERIQCCLNFLKLCKIKFYNYCLIHTVQKNFVLQTGDPSGTGRGGESVFAHLYGDQARYFDAEKRPKIKHAKIGTLSMVNNGQNMHGSQFLITLGQGLDYLDGVHTVFGEVAEGMDVLMKINETICDQDNKPYLDIRINHTVILEDPFPDPKGLDVPDRSPEPTREQLESGRIGVDEEIDDTKGKSLEEVEEEIKQKDARARAQVLEMVGDLPDADVKPPENVLFVCKLNPVTSDDDLEIIFSRFGEILSCEVIRDQKSGESLQYAFIEFEKEEDCEKAYFKMDNVLIDDRRIHVDFSQSVSKLKWMQRKGMKVNDKERDMAYNVKKQDGRGNRDTGRDRKRDTGKNRDRRLEERGGGGDRKRKSSPHQDRRTSPPGRRTSPHDRRTSPHDRHTSPHDRRTSPHDRRTSPHHDRRTSPHHDRRTSPHDRRTSPHDRRTSPHDRRTSPYDRRTSPHHDRRSSHSPSHHRTHKDSSHGSKKKHKKHRS